MDCDHLPARISCPLDFELELVKSADDRSPCESVLAGQITCGRKAPERRRPFTRISARKTPHSQRLADIPESRSGSTSSKTVARSG
jgi:hypothetical protein